MNNTPVNSIVIVGGGTSGWMTAAALSHHFKSSKVNITLIESSAIGTIGVGEATIPTLRAFYQKLGLSDLDVLKETAATCKLGIEFKNWQSKGSSFIHPFGIYGQSTKDVDFHHYWLRAKQSSSLEEYSLGIQLARHNKFTLPQEKPASQLDIFDWALHFDAALFAKLMKKYSVDNGVEYIDGKIEQVKINPTTGNIASLELEDSLCINGDLFIDCSGFKGLLIGEALNTEYLDWSEWLFCDSAVAVQSESVGEPLSRTVSTAHDAGWQWQIPLQHRQGNGHVYSSRYIDAAKAEQTLINNIEGKILHQPRSFKFTPGRRKKAWNKNCIAIGLSSGFLEPLESTSIALVQTAIEKVILSFEKPEYSEEDVNRFNQVNATEYERVRDFIILHYKLTQRDDSKFWRDCQKMSIPQSLEDKVAKYVYEGEVVRLPWEIFGKDSWLAIFDGFKLYPNKHNPKADNMPMDYLVKNLQFMRQSIAAGVNDAPTHADFLEKNCRYNANK